MSEHDRPLRYCSYLLRCWQERGGQAVEPSVWRFSLEDAHTGVRHGFATLEAVVAAIEHDLAAGGATRRAANVPSDGTKVDVFPSTVTGGDS